MNAFSTLLQAFSAVKAACHTSLKFRRAVREIAGCRSNMPVDVVPGTSAPVVTGRSYYWTTPSGKTEIRYPSAYRWAKWYHASTLSVVVGAEWAVKNGLI